MKRPLKVLILIGLLFSLRIFQSCLSCPETRTKFDYIAVNIKNLNNSGPYVTLNETNTMHSAAVAFEISITGDMSKTGAVYGRPSGFGFSEATASDDCPMLFSPNQTITGIRITTLESVSPQIPPGSDVTDLFVGNTGYLYEPIGNLYTKINHEVYSDDPTTSFYLFFKENILNPVAQFSFEVTFSDNTKITAESAQILLIASK